MTEQVDGPAIVPARRHGPARRYGAAFLSAIAPGLGQLALGHRRLAALFLAPVAVLAVAAIAVIATSDRAVLAARLVDPGVLAGLLALQLLLLAWRLLALGSSLLLARPPRYRARDIVPVALLVAFVVLPQAYLGALTNVARQTADEIFGSVSSGPAWRPSTAPSSSPLAPGTSPGPTATPSSGPAQPRLTVLLIGEDSGVGRSTALTDTMIVASLDPIGRTVSMLSIPRDLVDAPIPGGGTWQPKINGLAAWARRNPAQFPGSNGGGQDVLAGTISELIGVPIDYWAQVNLGGLIRIVDTVGGVDVTVPRGFCDPGYDEYGQRGFGIPAGRWHLDGSQALAYARVRKAAGESDFTRAARQQEILVGLRDALVRGGFLNDPIGFLQAIGQTLRTNVPPSLLPEVAGYASQIGRDRVFRAVITYPLVHPSPVPDPRGSIQIPDIPAIRALAAGLFPAPGLEPRLDRGGAPGSATGGAAGGSASPTPQGSPTPAGTPGNATPAGPAPRPPRVICRAPTQTPTPRPSASASPSAPPSASPAATPGDSGSPSPSAEPSPPVTPSPSAGASTGPEPTITPSLGP